MLNIKNAEVLKNIEINDWMISHVFKNFVDETGRGLYVFQLVRTGGIASTTISLEKEAIHYSIDLQTMEKSPLYELKGPAGTMNLYISEIKSLGAFINKMKLVC